MAIKLNTGLDIRTSLPIDKRFVLTRAEMFTMDDVLMPEVYFAICKEDKQIYIYDKTAVRNNTTGKFKVLAVDTEFIKEELEAEIADCVKTNDYEAFKTLINNNITALDEKVAELASKDATNAVKTITAFLEQDTYKLTISLLNQNNEVVSASTVDLPDETLVKNGYYDSLEKRIILVLENGQEIPVPIGDLVADLVTKAEAIEIKNAIPTRVSQLSNDAGYLTQHQDLSAFRSASAQDAIDSGKQDKLIPGANITIVGNVISAISGGGSEGEPAAFLRSATVNGNTLVLVNKDGSTVSYTPDTTMLEVEIASKQDAIEDLEAIKIGAALGASAVQPAELEEKQDKLIAGENITIVDNVISATAGAGVLEKTLTATFNVGGINVGDTFEAGTPIETVLRKLITVEKVLNSISVAMPPIKVNYLPGEEFDSTGMLITANYNTGSEVITDYTVTPEGPLEDGTTAITISYTFDGITKTTTQVISVKIPATVAKIYVGGAGNYDEFEDPTADDIANMTEIDIEDPARNLVGTHPFVFKVGIEETDATQYFAVVLPNEYRLVSLVDTIGQIPYTDFETLPVDNNMTMFYLNHDAQNTLPEGEVYNITVEEV